MNSRTHARLRAELSSPALLRQAHDYAAEYLRTVGERPVFPSEEAVENLRAFDVALPDEGEDAEGLLADLHRWGAPATVNQLGGRYFGFVNGGVVPAALAARWLADCWDQNGAKPVMSPVAARLEAVCERWLVSLFGLPTGTVAGFVSGSSLAIVAGLAAARYRLLEGAGWDVNGHGLYGAPRLRVVAGEEMHAAVPRALALLGLGTETVEWVATDGEGRLRVDCLPALDSRCLVVLQAGNVCSGAFDPIAAVCRRAREAGAWVHVDGAFGLWARAAAGLAVLCDGLEAADSWSCDAHKTLNAPYSCGVVLCRDREALRSALRAAASYLREEDGRDGMDYTPEMSRRARAVDLWMALRSLGRRGVDDLVTGLHEAAVRLADGLRERGFRVLNEVVFNQVLVAGDDAAMTGRVLRSVQGSGVCWAGGAVWRGEPVIRLSVCSWVTDAADVERTVAAFVAGRVAA